MSLCRKREISACESLAPSRMEACACRSTTTTSPRCAERGDDPEIGQVAGGEEDRRLAPEEPREPPLQLGVEVERAVEAPRPRPPGAVPLDRLHRGPLHARIGREAEVVVRAEHDQPPAPHDHLGVVHLLHHAVVGVEAGVLQLQREQRLVALLEQVHVWPPRRRGAGGAARPEWTAGAGGAATLGIGSDTLSVNTARPGCATPAPAGAGRASGPWCGRRRRRTHPLREPRELVEVERLVEHRLRLAQEERSRGLGHGAAREEDDAPGAAGRGRAGSVEPLAPARRHHHVAQHDVQRLAPQRGQPLLDPGRDGSA